MCVRVCVLLVLVLLLLVVVVVGEAQWWWVREEAEERKAGEGEKEARLCVGGDLHLRWWCLWREEEEEGLIPGCMFVVVPHLVCMVLLLEAGGGCILPCACHLSFYNKGRRKGKGGRKGEGDGRAAWCVPWLWVDVCVYVCVCVLVHYE